MESFSNFWNSTSRAFPKAGWFRFRTDFFFLVKAISIPKGSNTNGYAVECSEFEGGKWTPVQIWRNIGSNWREEFVLWLSNSFLSFSWNSIYIYIYIGSYVLLLVVSLNNLEYLDSCCTNRVESPTLGSGSADSVFFCGR